MSGQKSFRESMQVLLDIQKSHGVSEAECILIMQIINFVYQQGWSKKLAVKLLSAAAAMIDMIKAEDDESRKTD